MIELRHLFADLPAASPSGEVFETLLEKGGVKIERIVSHSAASPEGFWYDQEQDEWVLVVKGAATLCFEPDERIELKAGDHVVIPRHVKHRVAWTSEETIWVAVHVG
ncbi:MAG TPA: cupin domain-containing protein [Candidatus Saccharimonadia bacterium]|nr:cupin domain-containing protein [Candidatus Saccharimonadia bacterium]